MNQRLAQGIGERLDSKRELAAAKAEMEKWKHTATHHEISGLPNALGFELGVNEMRKQNPYTPLGIIAMDLSGFKALNDTLGHAKGDETLKIFGSQLRATDLEAIIDTTSIPGHPHGDEYLLASLLEGRRDPDLTPEQRLGAIVGRARNIGRILREQDSDLLKVNFDLSVGAVVMGPDMPLEDALRAADEAMYTDKQSGNRGR
jgi:diguanylate cyclase (GGDEF)-like protein